MNAPTRRWSRRSWIVWVAAILGTAATLGMGRWQLDRATQKEALQAALDAQSTRPAVPAADLARTAEAIADQRHRRITLNGTWNARATVYLDNRPLEQRPGMLVVTPLVLNERDAILVLRGWIPRNVADRTDIAPYRTDAGRVTITGRLADWPESRINLGAESAGAIRQNLDRAAIERDSGLSMRPLVLQQDDTEEGHGDGLRRAWPRPVVDVHKHYGYAAQWFGMAILITGLTLWFQILKPRMRQTSTSADPSAGSEHPLDHG